MKNLLLSVSLILGAYSVASIGEEMTQVPNWKLNLLSGKLTTPYTHYTVLADGKCGDMKGGFECPEGSAIMGIKVWATDLDEPWYMVKSIGAQIGFEVTGEIQVYSTEAEEPPRENPHGYDIQFTPYDE